jgi:hypothetical protein
MVEIPPQLTNSLSFPDAQLLRRVLGIVAQEMHSIYRAAVRHHRPRDNANIFGLRTWVHLWSALDDRRDDLGEAEVVEENNSFYLRVGPLKVGIHKLGHGANDDIHSSFPEGSATKRSYGYSNARQLSLFDSAPDSPLPDNRAFALRELTVGHFGNAKDGLAKWYLGAYVFAEGGRPRWAWTALQETTATSRPEMKPYSERPRAEVNVPPRRREEERPSSEGSQGV